MQFARLGSTGLNVSRICLGMMTYGTPLWRPWVLDEGASRPLVKQAVELGINFFILQSRKQVHCRFIVLVPQVVGICVASF